MNDPTPLLRSAARAGGAVLGSVFGAVSRLRPTTKPLHPRGELRSAVLTRSGLRPGVGASWVDDAGVDSATVRLSHAAGMPPGWPDVQGLGLRVHLPDGGSGDLLLATTGVRPITRHLLRPTRSTDRPMTTLLPYRSATGPVLLGAFPRSSGFDLAVASLSGDWQLFARLEVGAPLGTGDDGPRLDPVLNTLPGLSQYDWVVRLREPAYAAARRH